jgi:hypothetical protein
VKGFQFANELWRRQRQWKDVRACVARLSETGIPAHPGKEEQSYGVVWLEEDSDLERALTILRSAELQVVGPSKAHTYY